MSEKNGTGNADMKDELTEIIKNTRWNKPEYVAERIRHFYKENIEALRTEGRIIYETYKFRYEVGKRFIPYDVGSDKAIGYIHGVNDTVTDIIKALDLNGKEGK